MRCKFFSSPTGLHGVNSNPGRRQCLATAMSSSLLGDHPSWGLPDLGLRRTAPENTVLSFFVLLIWKLLLCKGH